MRSFDGADMEPERTPVRRSAYTPRRVSFFPYPEEVEVPLLPGVHEPRIVYIPKKTIKHGIIWPPIRDVDRQQPRLCNVPGGWGKVGTAGI